jgi:hypothetical protein
MLLEADVGAHVAIDTNRFDKLLTLTRTAIDYDGMLDKECISYNEIFDAFRLSLNFWF